MSRREPPEGPFQLVVGTVPLTVPYDVLLPLEDAVDLPRLGGLFTLRDLRRYANPKRTRNRLPAVLPGREWLTMKGGKVPHADGATSGMPSMSDAAAAAAASLEARLAPSPAKPKPPRKGK